MRRQDMSVVGEQAVRHSGYPASFCCIPDFPLVAAVQGDFRSSVHSLAIPAGVFGIGVYAFEEGSRVSVTGLRGQLSCRHLEVASDDRVHDQVIFAVFGL